MITATDKIRHIKAVFGGGSLDVRGANIAVECPACGKTGKRKLSIQVETGQCHCWVCGLRARRVSSVLYRYVSKEIAQEYRRACEDGRGLDERLDEDDEEKEAPPLTLPEDFVPLFARASAKSVDARQAVKYLMTRGLSVDDIVRFRMGITDQIRRRVVIPSFDHEGRLNFYTARAIDPDIRLRYTNCQVKKTDVVFNELNIDWDRELILVEGPLDLVKCPDNATCLLGSSLGEGHLLFQRIAANRTPTVLALDPDMRAKSQKIAELLYSYDCRVRIVDLQDRSRDIGDMSHRDVAEAVRDAPQWRPMDRLLYTISNIRSGSIL